MKIVKQLSFFLVLLFAFLVSVQPGMAMAQQEIEMADTLRSNGKIYIVVLTLFSIMAGIFFYLFVLEKRIAKLEKSLEEID